MKTDINYTITVFLAMILLNPSLMAQKSVYALPFENEQRLPAMNVHINLEEIASSYQTTGQVFTSEFTGPGDESMEQVSTSYINDEKVVDAIRFIENYLDNQLLASGSEKHGTVEMSVTYFNMRNGFGIGGVLGVATFGLGTLLGIPYGRTITDVELEALFFDAQDQFISKYHGVGHVSRPLTLYNSSSTRLAHQKALKEALEEMNNQITGDSLLTARLISLH
ncbi:MAG: hypothetical protein JXR52_00375 [Bacteroidales bacterium]|nr:hypothetical protein [Bacteroidales bacterium]MBN2697249.1 hypothetical protein [Bacteroidales bacterium]